MSWHNLHFHKRSLQCGCPGLFSRQCGQSRPPRSLGWPLALHTNDNTKDEQANKEERRGWAMIEIKHNNWLNTKNYLTCHILWTCLNDKKTTRKMTEMVIRIQCYWNQIRPHLRLFFCMSDHNLILDSYRDTGHWSWAKWPDNDTQMCPKTQKRGTTLGRN